MYIHFTCSLNSWFFKLIVELLKVLAFMHPCVQCHNVPDPRVSIALYLHHFVWWLVAQFLLLFQFAMSWGPCILVQCIAVDLRPLHTTAKEGAGSVLFWSRTCTRSNRHVSCCTSKCCTRNWKRCILKSPLPHHHYHGFWHLTWPTSEHCKVQILTNEEARSPPSTGYYCLQNALNNACTIVQ
jgi:hypothetical protein